MIPSGGLRGQSLRNLAVPEDAGFRSTQHGVHVESDHPSGRPLGGRAADTYYRSGGRAVRHFAGPNGGIHQWETIRRIHLWPGHKRSW